MTPDTRRFVGGSYPFGFSLSPFDGPRYPPLAPNSNINPAELKDTLLKESPAFSAKLHAFNNNYHSYASDLFKSGALLQNPKTNPNNADYTLQESLDILRKENFDLKRRIEQLTRGRH